MTHYCDYIAHLVSGALIADHDDLLEHVGPVRLHLSPEGSYLSSRKELTVDDINGQKYRVIIEAIDK